MKLLILTWIGLTLAVSAAVTWLPRSAEICWGAGGGAFLGGIGLLVAVLIVRRCQEALKVATPESGAEWHSAWNIWGLWSAGFLMRLLGLGVITLLLARWSPDGLNVSLLTLCSVYLTLLTVETFWLHRRLMNLFECAH